MGCLACRMRRYCYERCLSYSDTNLAEALALTPRQLLLWLRGKEQLQPQQLQQIKDWLDEREPSSPPGSA